MQTNECKFCAGLSEGPGHVHMNESWAQKEVDKDEVAVAAVLEDLKKKYPTAINFCPVCGKAIA